MKPHLTLPSNFKLLQLRAFSPSVSPEVGTNLAQDPDTAAIQDGPASY